MQVKKITAKIRDMVKVSLMENGDERAWYNNIEMPDEIKDLEMKDFRFNVLMDGKIEFQIIFEPGILPNTFPEKKARKRRTSPTANTAPPALKAGMEPKEKPAAKAEAKPPAITKDMPDAKAAMAVSKNNKPTPPPLPKPTTSAKATAAAQK